MPIRNKQVKKETSLDKIKPSNRSGWLKTAHGRAKDIQNARVKGIKCLAYNKWRIAVSPMAKAVGFPA